MPAEIRTPEGKRIPKKGKPSFNLNFHGGLREGRNADFKRNTCPFMIAPRFLNSQVHAQTSEGEGGGGTTKNVAGNRQAIAADLS